MKINKVFKVLFVSIFTFVNFGLVQPVVAAVADPIIKDGSFEGYGSSGASTDWRKYGLNLMSATNEESSDGEYSLYIDATGVSAGVQQLNLRVEVGKTYRLTVNQKLLSGSMTVLLGVGSSNNDFESAPLILYPKNIWQPAVREITIPQAIEKNGVSYVNADGTVRDFRLVMNIRGGRGYIDEVSLEEIAEADKSLIAPLGTANWQVYNSLPIIEETIGDELHIIAGNKTTGLDQTVNTVKEGHTYELSYDALVKTGTMTPYLIISGISKNADFENFVNPLYAYSYQNWNNVSRIFTVPQGYNSMNFRFVIPAGGEVSFKNLTLREIANNPLVDTIVRDDDMEWENAGLWTNIYTPEIKEKVDGTLHIKSQPGANYGVYERSLKNLEPSTTYTLSFDVKVVAGSIMPMIGNNSANGDFEKARMRVFRNANEDFVTYTDTFTTLADASKPYSLLLMAYRGGGFNYAEAYIDNVNISKMELPDPIVPDNFDLAFIGASFSTAYGCDVLNCSKAREDKNISYNPVFRRYTQLVLGGIKSYFENVAGENFDNANFIEHNFAINGSDLATMLLNLEDYHQINGAIASNPDLIIFWPEGNDTLSYIRANTDADNVNPTQAFIDNNVGQEANRFEDYLETIVMSLKNNAVNEDGEPSKIVIGTVPDFSEMPCVDNGGGCVNGLYGSWGTDEIVLSEYVVDAYNQKINEIAQRENIPVVDFGFVTHPEFYANENYVDDGLHFSGVGHGVVSGIWVQALDGILEEMLN